MAGASSERQENGLIKAINDAVKANKKNAVTVVFENLTLSGITKAEKYGGRQAGGSEPYTDVTLYDIP